MPRYALLRPDTAAHAQAKKLRRSIHSVERVGNLALRGMPLQPGGDGGEDEGDEEPGAGGGVGAARRTAKLSTDGSDKEDDGQGGKDASGRHIAFRPPF